MKWEKMSRDRRNNKAEVTRKNREIRARQVRLVSAEGEQLGIRSIKDALSEAQKVGLDLVEIAPQARPPVCKIMDYSKYAYQKSKRDKANKQKKKVTKVLNFKYKIDDHDLDIKVNQAKKFLDKGNDVRIEMRFRGREALHTDRMVEKMEEVCERLLENGRPTKPSVEQRAVVITVAPKPTK